MVSKAFLPQVQGQTMVLFETNRFQGFSCESFQDQIMVHLLKNSNPV